MVGKAWKREKRYLSGQGIEIKITASGIRINKYSAKVSVILQPIIPIGPRITFLSKDVLVQRVLLDGVLSPKPVRPSITA